VLSKVTAKDVYNLLGMILLVSCQDIIFYLSCQIYSNGLDDYDVTRCLVLCSLISGGSVARGLSGPGGGLARTPAAPARPPGASSSGFLANPAL